MDPYGNYAVQHLYERLGEEGCSRVTEQLLAGLRQYTQNKYSCSMIEKCVTTFCRDYSLRVSQAVAQLGLFEELLAGGGTTLLQKVANG